MTLELVLVVEVMVEVGEGGLVVLVDVLTDILVHSLVVPFSLMSFMKTSRQKSPSTESCHFRNNLTGTIFFLRNSQTEAETGPKTCTRC